MDIQRMRYDRDQLREVMKTDLSNGRPVDRIGLSLLPYPVQQDWEPRPGCISVMAALQYAKRQGPRAVSELLADGLKHGLIERVGPERWSFVERYVRVGTKGRKARDQMNLKFFFTTYPVKEST